MAQQTSGGQPIIILKEGSTRTRGRDAQGMNLMAARAVAEAVRTTLGPKGMDKMLVDSLGDVVITNDGVTILKEMDIEHPAAKMIVEIAKTQDDEVGDGTTTAVVLAGELLKRSEALLDQDVHPTVIASGYRQAAAKAREILDSLAYPVTIKDEDLLKKFAITAMTGKGAEAVGEKLADLVVKSIKAVVDENGKVDVEDIKVEKKVGGTIGDSELIEGLVIDKERIHPNMPKTVKNAKIALIDTPLEIEKTEIDAKIEITSPDQLQTLPGPGREDAQDHGRQDQGDRRERRILPEGRGRPRPALPGEERHHGRPPCQGIRPEEARQGDRRQGQHQRR